MNAPFQARPGLRDPFTAFVCDDATADMLRPVAVEHGWSPEKVNKGGLRNAVQTLFRGDIRKHIDDIAKKYIVPGKTDDGAVMFLPAEALFAEIHAYYPELVAFARTLEGIDAQRIALFGTSFSGGHVVAAVNALPSRTTPFTSHGIAHCTLPRRHSSMSISMIRSAESSQKSWPSVFSCHAIRWLSTSAMKSRGV